jgi:hypothetical protein
LSDALDLEGAELTAVPESVADRDGLRELHLRANRLAACPTRSASPASCGCWICARTGWPRCPTRSPA